VLLPIVIVAENVVSEAVATFHPIAAAVSGLNVLNILVNPEGRDIEFTVTDEVLQEIAAIKILPTVGAGLNVTLRVVALVNEPIVCEAEFKISPLIAIYLSCH
jgi:hypothetical protein